MGCKNLVKSWGGNFRCRHRYKFSRGERSLHKYVDLKGARCEVSQCRSVATY